MVPPTLAWPHPPPVSNATRAVTDGQGVLDGEIGVEGKVVDISIANGWPGWIRTTADGDLLDVSTASGGALILMVRSSSPE